MKKILLVDDDATIREIYRNRFLAEGFDVSTAEDGLVAAKVLREIKPDLVVLDLMMPRLSGVEVLKFIRSQPELSSTPVAIFTNSFMSELAEAANELGIQRAIVKAQCSPDALVTIANEIFSAPGGAPPPAPPERSQRFVAAGESNNKVRVHFVDHAAETLTTLRGLSRDFLEEIDPTKRLLCLDNFFRKVHFVAALAGMSGCHRVALLCGAFEALLFGLRERPTHIDPSTLHTIAVTMDFLEALLESAKETSPDTPLSSEAIIIDDDPLSNHLVVAALRRAGLNARAADNPLTGLELLRQHQFDLVLLDIEMPHMTGFDLCRKLRTLPGYASTPVIYVTAHSDFEHRATGVLSGGDDLIAKPVFPIELALKAVTHLIKSQAPASPAGR